MNNKVIPIFFGSDENYLPFLSVTISSIVKNSSPDYIYDIKVLCFDSSVINQDKIKFLETSNVRIEFVSVKNKVLGINNHLDEVRDYYTQAIFYRLFISSMYKELDKVIYLDSDIVLLSDIKDLYNIDLGDNILGVVRDDIVANNPAFKIYTKDALGINHDEYFNSGVLLMNLKEYRKNKIEEIFIEILNKSGFHSLAPDQDYLNVACKNKVKYLDKGWNFMPLDKLYSGKINLIHYNMFLKPWHYDVNYDEYFWLYASYTPYYEMLKNIKNNYSLVDKVDDAGGVDRMENQVNSIISSSYNFNQLFRKVYNQK